jgi:hypothetical protein
MTVATAARAIGDWRGSHSVTTVARLTAKSRRREKMDAHEVARTLKAFLATLPPSSSHAIVAALGLVLINEARSGLVNKRGEDVTVGEVRDFLLSMFDGLIALKLSKVSEPNHDTRTN